MTQQPIESELLELAKQIVAGPDDVADFAAIHAQLYKERRAILLGILSAEAMVAGDEREIDEQHPQLVSLRVGLRDRLQRLLAWARKTKRM